MLTLTTFKHFIAAILDTALTLAIKVIPALSASYVSYSIEQAKHNSWGDAWVAAGSYYLQLGGFQVILDKRIPAVKVAA